MLYECLSHLFVRGGIMDSNSFNISDPVDIGLVANTRGLDSLRKMATGDKSQKAQALKTAAQQFETLLMQQWVDAMRKTNEELNPDSPLHSKYSRFFEDMLAQQRVQALVNNGGRVNKNSITYMIAKQFAGSLGDEGKRMLEELEKGANISKTVRDGLPPMPQQVQKEGADGEEAKAVAAANDDMNTKYKGRTPKSGYGEVISPKVAATLRNLREAYGTANLAAQEDMKKFKGPEDFVEKMMPYAIKAAEEVGMNPLVLVAQAALETGWGDHVPANNNYFGIKAGASWKGQSMEMQSPEYEGGHMVSRRSRFRSYNSVLDSMKDYIKLIKENKRYEKAADKSFDPENYFKEIQKAGYATDPNYARKLKNIAQKIAFMAYK